MESCSGRVLLEHTPEGRNLQVCRRPVTPDVVVPSGSGPRKSRRSLQLRDDEICRALELSDGSSEEETDEELDTPTLRRLLREDLVDDGCEGMDDDIVEEESVEGP
ncbi:hypothetical protein evm_004143 [Chilo suppressalis]|nr:hypothetical protein evm_004143 [Chilo suppressalis]